MKIKCVKSIIVVIAVLLSNVSNITFANESNGHSNDPSSSIKPKKIMETDTCSVNSFYDDSLSRQSKNIIINDSFPTELNYLNKEVQGTYDNMRDKVINHVKKEVVLSLFKLNENGFSPENIASYVSAATKPFLPFRFANGVKIIDIKHKNGTIIYKAETPTHINHDHTVLITKAGIASATQTLCNDDTLVEDLLGRDIVIQYDYYDTNGVFICSFNIKENLSKINGSNIREQKLKAS